MTTVINIIIVILAILTTANSQWRFAHGSEGMAISDIDIYKKDADTIYAIGFPRIGTGGGLISTNGGSTWKRIPAPITDWGAIRIDPNNSQLLFISHKNPFPTIAGNSISITTDGFTTLKHLFSGLEFPAPVIEYEPHDNKTVYLGVGPVSLLRSSDQFQTHELVFKNGKITSLEIDPRNNNILYVGALNGVWKTTDKGKTWQQLWLGFQVRKWTNVLIDPSNSDIIYTTVSGMGVFKSTDSGSSWHERNNGLDSADRFIISATIHPIRSEEIFIGTFSRTGRILFRTTNGGDLWDEFFNGMPDTAHVKSIVVDTTRNRIFAGVSSSEDSSGIYFYDLNTLNYEIDSLMDKNKFLLQNYPNPFNTKTTIKFYTLQPGKYRIEIYDLVGRLVAIPYDGNLYNDEYYKINFYGSNFSSGIYFYRLVAPNSEITKRMILIK